MKLTRNLFAGAAVAVALILASCASAPATAPAAAPAAAPVDSDVPFAALYAQAAELKAKGAVVAIGTGISESGRLDQALDKAIISASGEVAKQYEVKVQLLSKLFTESTSGSTSNGEEINDQFSKTITNVAKKVLNGAALIGTPKQLKEGKKLTVAVLYGVDPKTLSASLSDEVKATDPKLYERFRASKAYEELQKEMADYDKK